MHVAIKYFVSGRLLQIVALGLASCIVASCLPFYDAVATQQDSKWTHCLQSNQQVQVTVECKRAQEALVFDQVDALVARASGHVLDTMASSTS